MCRVQRKIIVHANIYHKPTTPPCLVHTLSTSVFRVSNGGSVQSSPALSAQSSPSSPHAVHSFSSTACPCTSCCRRSASLSVCEIDGCSPFPGGESGRSGTASGGERVRRRHGRGEVLLVRMEERGDALALLLLPTRLGGYACSAGATAMSIALGAGVVEPEPVTVAVPELKDLGSSDGVGGISSRECERDCGCGFSMSYRGERPSSSSSSEERDARKSGSASPCTLR